MAYLNKIVNFFFRKFYTNFKYSSKILSITKIFFERNSKVSQTISKLGSVYRNSKWSSLDVQNVKLTSINQFSVNFVLALVIILSVFMMANRYLFFSMSSINFTPSYMWFMLQDWLSYFSLLSLSIIYFLITKIDLMVSNLIPVFFFKVGCESNTNTNIKFTKSKHPYLYHSQLETTPILGKNSNLLILNIQKVIKLLDLLNYSYPTKFNLSKSMLLFIDTVPNYTRNLANILFLSLKNDFNFDYKYKFILNQVNNSYIIPINNLPIYYTNVNLLGLIGQNFILNKHFINVVSSNLKVSKQNKWLTKSTIFSEKLVSSVSTTTHLKRLTANPTYNTSFLGENIWASNRVSNINNFIKTIGSTSGIDKDTSSILPTYFTSSDHLNLINYESSFFWLVKRFYFSQQMLHNSSYHLTLITSENQQKVLDNVSISSLFLYKIIYNFGLTNSRCSNYKLYFNGLPITTRIEYSVNSFPVLNNYEIFTHVDLNFLKLLFSNVYFTKNKIVFFSSLV